MADALTLEATVQWRPRSGAFPPPWSTRLSSLLLAVLYPHPPGRGRSLCSLEPLRRKVDGATMTSLGGARTPPRELSHLPSCSVHRHPSWGRSSYRTPSRGSGLFVFSNGIPIDIKSARALVVRT